MSGTVFVEILTSTLVGVSQCSANRCQQHSFDGGICPFGNFTVVYALDTPIHHNGVTHSNGGGSRNENDDDREEEEEK